MTATAVVLRLVLLALALAAAGSMAMGVAVVSGVWWVGAAAGLGLGFGVVRAVLALPAIAAVPVPSAWRWLAVALALAWLLAAVLTFVLIEDQQHLLPHGGWDAVAIWNLKARFVAAGPGAWQRVTEPGFGLSHPDYPLLLPGLVGGLDLLDGGVGPEPGQRVGKAFVLALVSLLALAVTHRRGAVSGAVAGLFLLAGSGLVVNGPWQMADIPLAVFLLAACVALALHAEAGTRAALLLAGFFAGAALWTKNEGAPHAVMLAAGAALLAHGTRRRAAVATFACGLAPALILWTWFKLALAPANDLARATTLGGLVTKVTDPERWRAVALGFWEAFRALDPSGFSLPVLAAVPLLAGLASGRARGIALRLLAVLLGCHGVVFAIYLVTPAQLAWHIHTSLGRLLFQVWPATVFAVFLLARGIGVARPREDGVADGDPETGPGVAGDAGR